MILVYDTETTGIPTFRLPADDEAAKIILGVEHVGAHDALADIRMTARLYFHIKEVERSA